jgi:hypothetical protein
MHFTVVFDSHESYDLSYGLLFLPCPVWVRGEQEVINLHYENPRYQRGDLRPLLDKEPILSNLAGSHRQAALVVHSSGDGTPDDLASLQEDLRSEGFELQIVTFVSGAP